MDAFEQMNQIRIELVLTLRNSAGMRGPWIEARAYIQPTATVEPVFLGSAPLQCSTTDFTSLDIAAFRALYALDLWLDGLEGLNEVKKSAASPAE